MSMDDIIMNLYIYIVDITGKRTNALYIVVIIIIIKILSPSAYSC